MQAFFSHFHTGIADCLVVLNGKNLPFQHQVAVTAHDHGNPNDEHETCRLKTLESTKLVGLDSTLWVRIVAVDIDPTSVTNVRFNFFS
jgi:hypothetical protein